MYIHLYESIRKKKFSCWSIITRVLTRCFTDALVVGSSVLPSKVVVDGVQKLEESLKSHVVEVQSPDSLMRNLAFLPAVPHCWMRKRPEWWTEGAAEQHTTSAPGVDVAGRTCTCHGDAFPCLVAPSGSSGCCCAG